MCAISLQIDATLNSDFKTTVLETGPFYGPQCICASTRGSSGPHILAKRITWSNEVHQCDGSYPHTSGDVSQISKRNWMTYNVGLRALAIELRCDEQCFTSVMTLIMSDTVTH